MDATTLELTHADATLDNVGGKGASLARLARAGLPVPGGFHVTTRAYRHFVEANDLREAVLAAAGRADPLSPEALEAASQEIRVLFEGASVPPEIAASVREAYARLGEACPVAVRSSATAEDLPDASFAGQQETFLNVRGAEALLQTIVRCWASLWTARAIAYRARRGIPPAAVSLAVVVQEMVDADAAGILFSANPITGDRDEAMITASWGLGEAVVGGDVTPDTLRVAKATGCVLDRETHDKRVMTVATDTGTEERPVPAVRRNAPVLSDAQAAELAGAAQRIEGLYGMPMDIEWAYRDGELSILQARPITRLPEEPAAALAWTRPDASRTYMRGSLAEFLPQPVSPLFASLGLPAANRATAELFRAIAGERIYVPGFSYTTINGYVYAGMRLSLREMIPYLWMVLVVTRKLLSTGTKRWREEAMPSYRDAARAWADRPLHSVPAGELLEGVREILRQAMRYYTVIQSGTIPSASSSELTFTRVYNWLVKRDGDPDGTALLFGFDSAPILAEKALFDLAAWCRERPALAEYLQAEPVARIEADLSGDRVPSGIEEATWAAWRAGLHDYLDAHGRTAYDLDFAKPIPADAPEPVLEALKLHLADAAPDPYARQRAAAERREETTRRITARLDPLRRRLFLKTLRWAQTSVPIREDCIAGLGLGYPEIRRLLGELGRRLADRGAIERADDVYWLEVGDLEDAVVRLDEGLPVPSLAHGVALRRDALRAARAAAAPVILPETSRIARLMPGGRPEREGDVLKGTGAGEGVVTARACVLHGPEDFDQMRPGDVLVAVTTTPAWTPLFAMASGVVTDIGGPLSHSSIVAREYGIPAVMGVGNGTRRIRTGDRITVDGATGRVTLPPRAARGMAEAA